MGKFIEEQDVIQTQLDNYIRQTYDFSSYIEGGPTFVTYYAKDILASTEDIPLGGVIETIGVESPIKYNKIENFPLYGMGALTPENNFDETEGLDTTIEGDAIILPNTVKPLVNDFFSVPGQAGNLLFRVNEVAVDHAGNKVMYKVSYSLTASSNGVLDEEQITETYKVVYENIGKDCKSVIKESDFLLLDHIDSVSDDLSNAYIKLFYNKNYNTFLYNDIIYDNILIRFITNNSLFIKTRTFLKNIKIEPLLEESMDDFYIYQESFFYALETKDISTLKDFLFTSTKVQDPTSIFALFKNKYEIWELIYNESLVEDPIAVLPLDFVSNIKGNLLYDTEVNPDMQIFNFVVQYLNNSLVNEDLIDYINKERFKSTEVNYMLIPCILFMLKQTKNTIMNK